MYLTFTKPKLKSNEFRRLGHEAYHLTSEMAVFRPVTGVRMEGERRVPRSRHRGDARGRRRRLHRQLRRRDQGVGLQ